MRFFIAFLLFSLSLFRLSAQEIIQLAGAWNFSTDSLPEKSGKSGDYVILPGSMLTNGKGDALSVRTRWTGSIYDSSFYFNPYMAKYREEGHMKFPFFLTPEKHYVGPAWYRRQVYVPSEWKSWPIYLFLERAHIETTVYVNGHEVGSDSSLSVPHRYNVSRFLRAGATNDIAIRVYNGIEHVGVGSDSHSVTDQTQGNWNGIVGRIELQCGLVIYHRKVTSNLKEGYVDIELNEQRYRVRFNDSIQPWDEFHPKLYTQTLPYDGWDVPITFGLREISIQGRQLYINGRPLFLRGTVENCCFPETGFPPMEMDAWMRIFSKCKEYGLNHMRFHSYCPPEAAFEAADRLGFYLQVEGPTWPNHGVGLRRGQPIDQYLLEESKRILDEYGHHPSFIMMAAGNEPAGDWVGYGNDWVKEMSQYDDTKIYAAASVEGGWAWDDGSQYHVKGGARGLDAWNSHAPSSDDDYLSGIEYPCNYRGTTPNQTPVIAHEQGQWCAFPDFSEIPQYTGVYKARNFEIFRDLLRDGGMAQMDRKFLMASGKLQTLCYKYEVERHLRTPGYAGFQLLGLNDYSGQGTALTGVLNVHWREKGYCSAADWHEFCSFLVPLARFPRFVYTSGDTLRVPVEAYNAYATPISEVRATYSISLDSTHVLNGGLLFSGTLPVGKNTPLGTVVFPLDTLTQPMKLTLTVRLTDFWKNHWDFWVYPKTDHEQQQTEKLPAASGHEKTDISPLFVTDDYKQALSALSRGRTVLLTAAGKVTLGSDVRQTYLPVFWNTSWFKMRPPHTTGVYIAKEHPLFRHGFPTDDWANLNWWELLNKAQVMNLREFPADYQPPIQPIDTWHVSRKLGMLVEAKVGPGRLLITTMDVTHELDRRPVARQMRRAILSYMQSLDFSPLVTLSPETVAHLFTTEAPAVRLFTKDSPDELKPKIRR